jgi:hypothetical protein
METQEIVEHIFKAVITLGVSMMIFILKDFKASLKELTSSLNAVMISLNSLLIEDKHKTNSIVAIDLEMKKNKEHLVKLEKQMIELRYQTRVRITKE